MTNPNPYRGVSWHKKQKRWRVKLKQCAYPKNREFYMEFPDEPDATEIAARVYDAAARMVFGPMATLNFPSKGLPGEVSLVRIHRTLIDAGWEAARLYDLTTPRAKTF